MKISLALLEIRLLLHKLVSLHPSLSVDLYIMMFRGYIDDNVYCPTEQQSYVPPHSNQKNMINPCMNGILVQQWFIETVLDVRRLRSIDGRQSLSSNREFLKLFSNVFNLSNSLSSNGNLFVQYNYYLDLDLD